MHTIIPHKMGVFTPPPEFFEMVYERQLAENPDIFLKQLAFVTKGFFHNRELAGLASGEWGEFELVDELLEPVAAMLSVAYQWETDHPGVFLYEVAEEVGCRLVERVVAQGTLSFESVEQLVAETANRFFHSTLCQKI